MEYEMPSMELNTGFLSKSNKKLKYHTIRVLGHTCREILLCDVAASMRNEMSPITIKNKCDSGYVNNQITYTIQRLTYAQFYQKQENVDTLNKLVNIIVGGLSVCLYHSDDDRDWRTNSKLFNLEMERSAGATLTFKFIPPSYLTNPISASLILGVIRDCINIVFHHSSECIKFIKMFKYNEIEHIIQETDIERALKLYYKHIEKFLFKHSSHSHSVLKSKKHLIVMRDFIDNGFRLFIPELTCMYWCSTFDNFGFERYVKTTEE
jgi:hypothetical protein